MYFPGDNTYLCSNCQRTREMNDKATRRKKKGYQTPDIYESPKFEPCVHRFFRKEPAERGCLTREQYMDMLATPKGYPWLEGENRDDPELSGKKSNKKKQKRKHEEESGKQELRCIDYSFAEEFINDMWDVMSPDVTDRLIDFLVQEFGMTVEEAEDFIDCKSLLGKPTPCVKKQSKAIVFLGPKHKWVKRFSDVFANRIEQYIVSLLMAKKTPQIKKVAQRILSDMCNVTGDVTSLQNPKTKRERTMVLIATRLAFWVEDIMKDLDKPRKERPTITEEEESEKEEEKEEREEKEEEEEKKPPEEETEKEIKEEEEETEKPVTEEKPEETPSEEKPDEEGVPAEEKPAEEEAPAKEKPDEEEVPAEEKPAEEETPAEEKPAEGEAPAEEEKPANEEAEGEKPVEETKPAEEEVPEEGQSSPEEQKAEEEEKEAEKGTEEVKPAEPPGQVPAEEAKPEGEEEIEEEKPAEEDKADEVPAEAVEEEKVEEVEAEEEKLPEGGEEEEEETPEEEVLVQEEGEEELPEEEEVPPEEIPAEEEVPEEDEISEKEPEKIPPKKSPIAIPRKPAVPAFEVRAKTGSTLQIQKLSSGTVVQQAAKAREVSVPPHRKLPASESPLNLKSAEDWVNWATNIVSVADEWGKWLESRYTDAEKQLTDKRKDLDWKALRDQAQTEALKWRVEEERIKDEGEKWSKKLDRQLKDTSETVLKVDDLTKVR